MFNHSRPTIYRHCSSGRPECRPSARRICSTAPVEGQGKAGVQAAHDTIWLHASVEYCQGIVMSYYRHADVNLCINVAAGYVLLRRWSVPAAAVPSPEVGDVVELLEAHSTNRALSVTRAWKL